MNCNKCKIWQFLFGYLAVIVLSFSGCSGGESPADSGSSNNALVEHKVTVPYKNGDMMNDDIVLPLFEESFSETAGAVVQAILAVNSIYPSDGEDIPLADFKNKYEEAKHALEILESSADTTDTYLDLFPDEPSAATYRAEINPHEVEAILNSSKSRSVLKPLMTHYKVNARKALEILQNAEAGIYTHYMDRAQRAENIVNVLKVVRDTSALSVTVGAAVLTAGGSAAITGGTAELTLGQSVGAIIQGSNAIVKLTKSSVELALGKDGALDQSYNNSIALRTLAIADDVVSIVSIKSLMSSGKWESAQDEVSDLVFLSGKTRDLLQDKKLTFGAESVDASDIIDSDLQSLTSIFDDPFPVAYGIPGISQHYSDYFKNIFALLPKDKETKSTADMILDLWENGDSSSNDNNTSDGGSEVSYVAFDYSYECYDAKGTFTNSAKTGKYPDVVEIVPSGLKDIDSDTSINGSINHNKVDFTEHHHLDLGLLSDYATLSFSGTVSSGSISGDDGGVGICTGSYTGRYITEKEANEIKSQY